MAEIYALIDPRTSEVRYIGKANDSQKRLKGHLCESRRTTPVYCWIGALRKVGLSPEMKVLCVTDDWCADERRLISEYRNSGARLLNIADGGDQPKPSMESLQKAYASLSAKRADPVLRIGMELLRVLGKKISHLKAANLVDEVAHAKGTQAKVRDAFKKHPVQLAYQVLQSPLLSRQIGVECVA